jgi:PAS domain S-box-containing protein
MRLEYKVIALAVVCFASVCVSDALLDHFVFREKSFWQSLLFDIPPHAAYHRSFITIAFLCFGIIVYRVLAKRREAEQALKDSEEKYRMIFENSPVGIFHYDSRGVITACNEKFVQIMGSSKQRLVGLNMPESIGNDEVRTAIRQSLSGQAGRYEGDYTSVTGHRSTVLKADFVPLAGKDGPIGGGIGIVEDVTDRRRAEELLVESEGLYRTLFERAQDAILILDAEGTDEGRIVSANKVAATMHGYSPEEFSSMNIADLDTEEEAPRVAERLRLLRERGWLKEEILHCKKDGTVVPVETSAGLIELGGHRYVLSVGRDVTERKRAEEELRRSKETVEALLNATTDSAFLIDARGRFLILNQMAARRFRRGLDELVGNVVFDFLSPDLAADRKARVDEVLRTGQPMRFQDTRDGRAILHTIYPVFGSEGEVESIAVFARDVTEQTKAQQLLLQTERFKAISDMAGGVAHNFNNLLQIIIGRAEQALNKLESGAIAQARNGLEQVLRSSRLGAQTVDRLQQFARHDPEDMNVGGTVFDLSDVALQAIQLTEPWWKTAADKEGIKISLDQDIIPGCLAIGRPNEIFEVIVNLIKNATEALPTGGKVVITTGLKDRFVVLRVSDSGVGIAEENLSRIFEPFWTTKGSEGTGLGLASTYGIVRRHGGFISVESLPNAGTAFTVQLPFAGQSAAAQAVFSEFSRTDDLHILVVDDMEPVLTVLGDALTECCGSVSTALSGQQALEIFERENIDLVICDLAMPGMNGWELGKIILQSSKARGVPKTPFVLLTGWGGKLLEQENVVEAGVDAVVQKPVDLRELLRVIGRVVPKRLKVVCEEEQNTR